ncbi:MAG: bifunctional protein FolC [Lachnospiraceae bacterium]|nr:bifunctional protein FolC [Lachnospiraceae bacterium]
MNYQEAEDYVYQSYLKAAPYWDYQTPDSQKRHPELLSSLFAESRIPAAVITGSKGKGSTAAMLTAILESQMRVGRMTSPHLSHFCDRFQVNGKELPEEEMAAILTKLKPLLDSVQEGLKPEEFISPVGIETLIALEYFSKENADFMVLECGKGARYDDVPRVPHRTAVITPIFLEHTRELGGTLAEIATDKAWVITEETEFAYSAPQSPEVLEVLRRRAAQMNTRLRVYGEDFRAEKIRFTKEGMVFDVRVRDRLFPSLKVPLLGIHQAQNCALALAAAVDIVEEIDHDRIKNALAALSWPGRMETLSSDPFCMLDACIHPDSFVHVREVLEELKIPRAVFLIGIPADKDYAGVIRAAEPFADQIFLTASSNPHYHFSEDQSRNMRSEGIETHWTAGVKEGITEARRVSKELDLPTIILGTTSVVSEVESNRDLI